MAASFRTIHSPALRAVTVIEKLGRKTCKNSSFFSLENELRDSSRILTEIDHKRLPRKNLHLVT